MATLLASTVSGNLNVTGTLTAGSSKFPRLGTGGAVDNAHAIISRGHYKIVGDVSTVKGSRTLSSTFSNTFQTIDLSSAALSNGMYMATGTITNSNVDIFATYTYMITVVGNNNFAGVTAISFTNYRFGNAQIFMRSKGGGSQFATSSGIGAGFEIYGYGVASGTITMYWNVLKVV